MDLQSIMRRRRSLLALGVVLVASVGAAGPAQAARNDQPLAPGAVFTQTNTVPNKVAVFQRGADGKLVAAGEVLTGGNGQPVGNPPFDLPFADSAGNVELASDGDSRRCLFVTNIGSSTVSSFRVQPDGIELADWAPTGGSRPVSLTSNRRGPLSLLLYVLNSDFSGASIQGYFVSVNCALTPIPGSHRPTADQAGLPAQIAFNSRGTVLSVTQRISAGGHGDLNVFPVDGNGVAGAAVASPSSGVNPYGQAWTKHDQLTISNANAGAQPASSVSSYQLMENNTLVPIAPAEVPSPGLACWNVITDNGKFLYVTNPSGPLLPPVFGGASITTYTIGRDGSLASAGPGVNVSGSPFPLNAIDEALSANSQYLYVLANQMIPFAGPLSTINQYSIDQRTGGLTFIGAVEMPRNSTSGLAAW
jgi:6-phosphogluconolactonase (cycloisomerase 2 family)